MGSHAARIEEPPRGRATGIGIPVDAATIGRTRLGQAGLQADIKKCEFNVTCTKYLGFIISTDSVEVDLEKVEAIRNWKYPTTVKGVQSFLGFCNFYRRFIRNYGHITAPLTQLTCKDHAFQFNPEKFGFVYRVRRYWLTSMWTATASLRQTPLIQSLRPYSLNSA